MLQNLPRLDAIHCTAALHAVAKHSVKDRRLAERPLRRLLEHQAQHDLDGRQLANSLWALARLRLRAAERIGQIAWRLAECAEVLETLRDDI